MEAILISIQSPHTCNILNDIKLWEIRKKFPKDYVGWVYIYCTKGKPNLWLPYEYNCFELDEASQPYLSNKPIIDIDTKMNGKVVARFWCDKVERLYEYQVDGYGSEYEIASDTLKQEELLKECCLTYDQLNDYLGDINNGYAIHITKLEIFDKPKELSEFCVQKGFIEFTDIFTNKTTIEPNLKPLTRAPESYCYIKIH